MSDDKTPELLLGEMCAKALEELDGANLKRAQLMFQVDCMGGLTGGDDD